MIYIRASSAILALSLIVSQAYANVVGPDPENFNPITDGLDFVTVQSSETLEPGILNFGLFSDYAVNSLPHFDNQVSYNRVNLNDFLLFGHLNAGVGLGKNWDAGVSLPYLMSEYVRDSNYSGIFFSTGFIAIEVNTKYRFTGDSDHGFALVGSANFNTLGNNPFTGNNSGPVYNLEAVYDNTFGHWAAGLDVGYRIRQPGTPIFGVPVEPLKNQYIGSLAASYLLTQYDTKIILELFGSYPAQPMQSSSDRSVSSLEALLGLKHDFNQNLAFHVGAGSGLFNGTASPSWRLYAGLNWTIGTVTSPAAVVAEVPPSAQPIPEKKEQPVQDYMVSSDLIFAFNSDKIYPAGEEILGDFAKNLLAAPVFKNLEIIGHTDSVGPDAYNQDLSQRRAQAAMNVLVEKFHLDAKKIRTKGLGSKQPIADNGNYQGRRKNRRVEFKVSR